MPTPRVAFLCGSGLVGPTLDGWCVKHTPGESSLARVKAAWGFQCRVPFGPVAARQIPDLKSGTCAPTINTLRRIRV